MDCELLKGGLSIKILFVARDTKPVSLSLEKKTKQTKNRLKTEQLSDVASPRAQFSLSIFWLPFLSPYYRFILHPFRSTPVVSGSVVLFPVRPSSAPRFTSETIFMGKRMGCTEELGLDHTSILVLRGI